MIPFQRINRVLKFITENVMSKKMTSKGQKENMSQTKKKKKTRRQEKGIEKEPRVLEYVATNKFSDEEIRTGINGYSMYRAEMRNGELDEDISLMDDTYVPSTDNLARESVGEMLNKQPVVESVHEQEQPKQKKKKKRRKNKSDENRIGNIRIPIETGEIGKLEPSFDAESLILDANKRKYQPQYENMEDKNIAVGLAVDDDNEFYSKQREEKVKKKKGKKRTKEKNKKETSNILQNRQEEMFSTLTESKFSEEMESTHCESKNIESDNEGCNMEGENDNQDAFAETDENNGKKNFCVLGCQEC